MSLGLGIDLPMPFETRLIAHEYALGVDVPVVRSSDEAWEAFARASEEFGAALADQRDVLSGLIQQNPFGECIEGLAMHERVNLAIQAAPASVAARIDRQYQFLAAHADMCRASGAAITQSDNSQSR